MSIIRPQHVSASLDERLRALLQQGHLPRTAIPLTIEDDNPDDFDFTTPDGSAYGLSAWDVLSKHEISAARSSRPSTDHHQGSSGGDQSKEPSGSAAVPPASPVGADNVS